MRFLKRHYYLLQMTVHSGHTSVRSTPKFKLGSLNCKISFAFSLKIAGLKNKLFDHCALAFIFESLNGRLFCQLAASLNAFYGSF